MKEAGGGRRAFRNAVPLRTPPAHVARGRLPTGMEALAWVASALRLSEVRGGTAGFSERTAKRIASGSALVSADKMTALLVDLVRFAVGPYLKARGLGVQEVAAHEHLFLAAIEGALALWDHFAAIRNAADAEERHGIDVMIGALVVQDLMLRVAALNIAHARTLPVLRNALRWDGPGVAGALRDLRARAARKTSDASLAKAARISSNALRACRDGLEVPSERTLMRLAKALAALGVDGAPSEAEVLFELRVASLLAKGRVAAALVLTDDLVSFHSGTLRFLMSDLRRYDPRELIVAVATGTDWPRWREVHHRMSIAIAHWLGGELVERERRRMQEFLSLPDRPDAQARWLADDMEQLAATTRASITTCPGWERTAGAELVRWTEDMRDLFGAVAEGRPAPAGHHFGDTFEAKCLVDRAIAPWERHSPEQRERLLFEAVERDPACAYARYHLGFFLASEAKRFHEAIVHLRAAVTVDEDYDEARELLISALLCADRRAEALQVVEDLERRTGVTAETLDFRGQLHFIAKEYEQARVSFEKVLALDDRDVRGHEGMAAALDALGDRAGSRRHTQAAKTYAGLRPPRVSIPKR